MKHLNVIALAAGSLAAVVPFAAADTFTVQPLGGPTDPIYLSAGGTQGVRPQQNFWSAPDQYVAAAASASIARSSPDGQWGLGSNSLQGRAGRFSRSGGAEVFLNAANGLTTNFAWGSSSGNSTVVGVGTFTDGATHGFVWTSSGGTADLGLLVTDRTSAAIDVSAGGTVIVGYGDAMPPGVGRHPLRWTGGGTTLSRLARSGSGFLDGGEATAVSADGVTVVGFRQLNGVQRGFRWTQSGFETDLPSPSNPNSLILTSRANDVSGDGVWTAGESATVSGPVQATMWNAAGQPFALADLLTAAGEEQHAFYDLRSIASISSDGRTVSGTCFDPAAGQFRAFVATLTFATGGGCAADLGRTGGAAGGDGVLDNNDFIVFIDGFFNANPVMDFGSTGGVPGSDGVFDNNDFVVFIDQFFTGCA